MVTRTHTSSTSYRTNHLRRVSLILVCCSLLFLRLDSLEVGKSYVISGASVRPSRSSQYEVSSSVCHEMIVSNETNFTLVTDGSDQSLPRHSLGLIPFSSLQDTLARQKQEAARQGQQGGFGQGYAIDVIGIVVDAQPMQGQGARTTARVGRAHLPHLFTRPSLCLCPRVEIMSKKQQVLFKRDVTLMDTTGTTVKITLWVRQVITQRERTTLADDSQTFFPLSCCGCCFVLRATSSSSMSANCSRLCSRKVAAHRKSTCWLCPPRGSQISQDAVW